MKNYIKKIKERKFLAISIILHVAIIIALLIILPLWKINKKEPVKIQEVELFNPQPQQPDIEKPATEQATQPQKQQTEQQPKKPKRKPPAPLKSSLKTNVIKKWDTIEKKN